MAQEFDRIAAYLAPLSRGYDGAFDLKDDVALLDAGKLVVTTDTIVQGVHYIGDEAPELIAQKLMRCNLSDLAAKGAAPAYYTLNLTLTSAQNDQWFKQFAQGLAADQAQYGLTLIGGDSTNINNGPCGPCVLSMTAFGKPTKGAPLPTRNRAKIGDIVCVSGTIGDAAIGLKIAQSELQIDDTEAANYLIDRYQLPKPRVALGQKLAPLMHASMDISDGLMQDAGHIAHCSKLGLVIEAAKIPLSDALNPLLDNNETTIQDIASGGDDYEILCTIAKDKLTKAYAIAASLNTPFTAIGKVIEGKGAQLLDVDGQAIALTKIGYTHN